MRPPSLIAEQDCGKYEPSLAPAAQVDDRAVGQCRFGAVEEVVVLHVAVGAPARIRVFRPAAREARRRVWASSREQESTRWRRAPSPPKPILAPAFLTRKARSGRSWHTCANPPENGQDARRAATTIVTGTKPFATPSLDGLARSLAWPPGSKPCAIPSLDELGEFPRSTLEVLRQPLEEGAVTIARAAGTLTFPARFTLVASMNPCPCGYRGDRAADCRCDEMTVQKYLAKLSGPLLDRIDLHVTVSRVSFDELVGRGPAESSATVRGRVEAARKRQAARLRDTQTTTNAAIPAADVRRLCPLSPEPLALLEGAVTRGALSARAFDRVVRVARTIADLAGADRVGREHVAEALVYRGAASRG
jgi:MoxR-like ATPase